MPGQRLSRRRHSPTVSRERTHRPGTKSGSRFQIRSARYNLIPKKTITDYTTPRGIVRQAVSLMRHPCAVALFVPLRAENLQGLAGEPAQGCADSGGTSSAGTPTGLANSPRLRLLWSVGLGGPAIGWVGKPAIRPAAVKPEFAGPPTPAPAASALLRGPKSQKRESHEQ